MALQTTLKLTNKSEHLGVVLCGPLQSWQHLTLRLQQALEVDIANPCMDASLHPDIFRIFCGAKRTSSSVDRSCVDVHGRLLLGTAVILLGFFYQSFEIVKASLSAESVVQQFELLIQFSDLLVFIMLISIPFSSSLGPLKCVPRLCYHSKCDVCATEGGRVLRFGLLRSYSRQLVVEEEVELVVFGATIFAELIQLLLTLFHV